MGGAHLPHGTVCTEENPSVRPRVSSGAGRRHIFSPLALLPASLGPALVPPTTTLVLLLALSCAQDLTELRLPREGVVMAPVAMAPSPVAAGTATSALAGSTPPGETVPGMVSARPAGAPGTPPPVASPPAMATSTPAGAAAAVPGLADATAAVVAAAGAADPTMAITGLLRGEGEWAGRD